MRISKLIKELQDILDSNGDVNVFMASSEGDGMEYSVSQVSYNDYSGRVVIE